MPHDLVQLAINLPADSHYSRIVGARNRFVLVVLAHLADDEGQATVSVSNLCHHTEFTPGVVRTAIHAARDRNLLTITEHAKGPNTYSLNIDLMRQLQPQNRQRANDSLWVLVDYDVDEKTLNALARAGCTTLTTLGKWIAEFEQLPAHECVGFHTHVDVRGFGIKGGKAVVDAYHAMLATEANP